MGKIIFENTEAEFLRFQKERKIFTADQAAHRIKGLVQNLAWDDTIYVLAYPNNSYIFQINMPMCNTEYELPDIIGFDSEDLEEVERALFEFLIDNDFEFKVK